MFYPFCRAMEKLSLIPFQLGFEHRKRLVHRGTADQWINEEVEQKGNDGIQR
jgi:hypothetical protein